MIDSLIYNLLECRPFGPVALVAFSVSTAAALALVVAALFTPRSGATKATRAIGALVAVTFALGVFAASRVIANARVEMLQPMPVDAFYKVTWAWGRVIMESRRTWQSLALAVVLVATLSGTALALLARRAGARRPLVITAALACLLGALTGAGILYRFETDAIWVGDCGHHAYSVEEKSQCVQTMLQYGVHASSRVRVGIVALSVLASGLVFVLSRRRAEEPAQDREAPAALGAAVFAFGLAAWFGARGMAYDARHTLPLPEAPESHCGLSIYPPASSRPPAGPCEPGPDALEVILNEEGLHLGWERLDVRQLGTRLQVKLENQNLKDPVVVVVAPAATPMATMLPILSAVKNDSRRSIAILRGKPERSVSTATLGELRLHQRCCMNRLRIAPDGAPLSNHATWGDVARASSEGVSFRLDP
ncbi:hypothetical protein [Polyangium sp. 6x1]|uniref:hypothetical protein n=1 Tax=Polyangium sp. 6x1 TaxID=3042689 RepID=UPI0024830183|nr:hypothetical protein [Polyangium sp. 6x1]MDI1442901.1 hypothetical protein [Polyangium sp. 6x1]